MFRLPLPAILVLVPIFASPLANAQRTLQVLSQFTSVQSAIDQASNGDMVSIAPGTYTGSINFSRKRITVQGSADGVVITPSAPGLVVSFVSGESRASVLANVTLQGGVASTLPSTGGIILNGSSPTIQGVTVKDSEGCGIAIISSAPAISNTVVTSTTFLPNSEPTFTFDDERHISELYRHSITRELFLFAYSSAARVTASLVYRYDLLTANNGLDQNSQLSGTGRVSIQCPFPATLCLQS